MADTSSSKLFKPFSTKKSNIIKEIYGQNGEIFSEKFDIEKVIEREQLYYKKMNEETNDKTKDETTDNEQDYKRLKSFEEFKKYIEMLKQKSKSSDEA
jgi:hypothetical protein